MAFVAPTDYYKDPFFLSAWKFDSLALLDSAYDLLYN